MIFPDAKNIKTRRERLGIKQKELAKKAQVSQSLITKLENNKIDVSYSIIKKIFLALDSFEHKSEKKASDVMTQKIYYLKPIDTVQKAKEIMKARNVSQIPIIQSNNNLGSISETDILDHFDENISKKTINDIISPPYPIVDIQTPVSLLIPLLKYSNAVLVSQKGKLTGIITKSDLL